MASAVHTYILTALFTALTSISSFIRVPFPLVPITAQTLFVYMSGNILGSKRGAVSQVLFLAVGLCGLPVFAMGGGIGYVLKPSFGYLLAFPFAAWVSGRAHHSREAGTFIRANIYAALVIFVSGSVYLYTASNLFLHVPVTIFQAVLAGFLVFVPGEIVKIAAAGVLCAKLQDAARRIEL